MTSNAYNSQSNYTSNTQRRFATTTPQLTTSSTPIISSDNNNNVSDLNTSCDNTTSGISLNNEAAFGRPSLEPYITRLERFELFSTNQCYYLIGCNRLNTSYRVLKMDRTLIERAPEHNHHQMSSTSISPNSASVKGFYIDKHNNNNFDGSNNTQQHHNLHYPHQSNGSNNESQTQLADNSHTAKPTLRPLSDFLTEDPNVYTQEEIKEMLDMIHDGNRMTKKDATPGDLTSKTGKGGLKPLVKAYGVVGFVRFLDCYYLTLITRRAKVGCLGGNSIYTIKNTETIPLKPAERGPVAGADDNADPSSVLLSMWNRGKRSVGLGLTNREIAELRYQGLYQVVDLTKNFYFSYTYDLTCSLQDNFLATTSKPFPPAPFKDMYAWNFFLTREFEKVLTSMTNCYWIMPVIHGAFVQRKVSDYGRCLNLLLIARRSRHFAGTRYLKRGVSEQGKVANDVEHEQILHDESLSSPGTFSSYLQVRGSIPTFWTQESSVTMPKPPIELNRVDPTYTATRLHFADLFMRYSSPILICDLVKQSERREREVRVGNEYRHAVDYINDTIDHDHKIRYCALDYSHISKHRNLDVSNALNEVATWAVNQTGFFCSDPKWKINKNGTISPFTDDDIARACSLANDLGVPVFPMEQHGVLRTNCIDCLDRTNVAQFSAGVDAIGQQLVCMGIRSKAKLSPSSNIVRVLIDMYVDIGDSISIQYGGSEAHKKVQQARSESNITGPIGKHKELLTSIRRYYSNAFTDRLKQDAMNLFLGYYLPYCTKIPLWEMESDYYLHNFHVKSGKGTTTSMMDYRRAFGLDCCDDDEESSTVVCNEHDTHSSRSAFATRNKSDNKSRDFISNCQRSIESSRVSKVRNRCKSQNLALSTWWKASVQMFFQQRMWMRRGSRCVSADLPPHFDRVYQLDKLSQFDRFFSRTWSTPVRRSHAAQHTDGTDDEDAPEFPRVISLSPLVSLSSLAEEVSKSDGLVISEFIKKWGFGSRSESTLKLFAEHHASCPVSSEYSYIGKCEVSAEEPRQEYLQYVAPLSKSFGPPNSYKASVVDEFKSCLHDYMLGADDVAGIQKLATSAHLGEKIQYGQFRGLHKDDSAVEVATAIQMHFNMLDSFASKEGKMADMMPIVGVPASDGVVETLGNGLKHFEKAEKIYSEIIESKIQRCQRSHLTDTSSLILYASEIDDATRLLTADQIFLEVTESRRSRGRRWPTSGTSSTAPVPFVKKAARLGIHIDTCTRKSCNVNPPLYTTDVKTEVPPGFEQINEDMFARTENKFMVFNGAGVDSWNGNQRVTPVTKISDAEKILMSTFS